jgi:hypothetical protein
MPDAPSLIRTARLIWLGLLVATGFYLLVLVVVLGAEPAAPADVPTLRRVLMVLSLAAIAGIYVLRRRLPLEALASRPSPSPQAVFSTYVVCWALSEAVGLFGLVVGFVGRSVVEAQPFFMVAAALLLWQRPRPAYFGA